MKDKCENLSACKTIKSCNKRHPKVCKRYVLEQFCKFGTKCSYDHGVPVTNIKKDEDGEKIEMLKNIVKELQEHVKQLENVQKAMSKRLEEICSGSSIKADTTAEKHDSAKVITKVDMQKCAECDYQFERKNMHDKAC